MKKEGGPSPGKGELCSKDKAVLGSSAGMEIINLTKGMSLTTHTVRHRLSQTDTDFHRHLQTDTDYHRQTQTFTDRHTHTLRQTQPDTDRHRPTQTHSCLLLATSIDTWLSIQSEGGYEALALLPEMVPSKTTSSNYAHWNN